ncbi:ATP-binding protein [Bacillus pseudomycoides]|uniref:ATP-binding protein n=1 Tax=Bacillus pseudomycoides TaxID=64104 RepID=UPI003D1FC4C9
MFRILQESITNVIRHSGANEVDVCIQEHAQKLSLIVSDNGQFLSGNLYQNSLE